MTDKSDGHDDTAGERLTFPVALHEGEVRLLEVLIEELRALLLRDGADEVGLQRLRPPAYEHAPEQEAAWQLIARSNLDDRRIEALATMEKSLTSGTATVAELHDWLVSLNAMRLVLGVQLGVTQEEDEDRALASLEARETHDDEAQRWQIYRWLGMLLEVVISALSADETPDA